MAARQTLATSRERRYWPAKRLAFQSPCPSRLTSGVKAEGRLGKQDSAYLPDEDIYRRPTGQLPPYHYINVEHGMTLRRYSSTGGHAKAARSRANVRRPTSAASRVARTSMVEEVRRRLYSYPDAVRTRGETVEHPFCMIKARMGALHFLIKRLRKDWQRTPVRRVSRHRQSAPRGSVR